MSTPAMTEIGAFLVDQDHTVGVERAEIDLARDQRLKLNVAPADENQLRLQVFRRVEAFLEPDVERQVKASSKSCRL